MDNLQIVILAGGYGKRMKSNIPKVCHKINGKPMISIILESIYNISLISPIVVTNKDTNDEITNCIEKNNKNLNFETFIQNDPNGTGDAIMQLSKYICNSSSKNVLICPGDCPTITNKTLQNMVRYHIEHNCDLTLSVTKIENPHGYGRIVKDTFGNIEDIIEEKDCDDEQKSIKIVNSGIYIFNIDKLCSLCNLIGNNNNSGEYYITSLVNIFYNNKLSIKEFLIDNKENANVNTQENLLDVSKSMSKYIEE